MNSSAFHRHLWVRALALGAVITLAACSDRGPTEDDHGEPAAAEVIDRDTGERLAWTHGTGADVHWDGELPHLHPGEGIEVDVNFFDDDGNMIPLDGEFELRGELGDGAATDIIEIESHGDHLDIEGVGVGETAVVFHLWHGGHADWTTPALEVHVEDHGDEGA